MFMVEESIRFCTLAYVSGKSFDELEKVFHRHWVALYGAPQTFVSDREGALASDAFGFYLGKIGTERKLFTVKDEMHTRIAVLDRRVQLFRTFAPRLADQLAQYSTLIIGEDLAAECQLAIN